MPGHSSAAIAAYPELSCFPEEKTIIPEQMISAKSKQELANGKNKIVPFLDIYFLDGKVGNLIILNC